MSERPSRRQLLKQCAQGVVGVGTGRRLTRLTGAPVALQDLAPLPTPDRQRLEGLIAGYQVSQMLHVVARLKIADLLENGPRSTTDLAAATATHDDTLYRLMRTLASLGIFVEDAARHFRLNAAAGFLRSRVPGSLRLAAEITGEEWMWRPWGDLLGSVRTGQTAFDRLYGKGTFDWFTEHPDAGRLFDASQAQTTAASARSVVDAFDFSPVRTIIDVGGGDGTLLSAALRANPSARGVLFDLPAVVEAARLQFDPSIVARTEFVGGDFFTAVPTSGEVYVMKSILHDWSDADCERILAVTRRALSPPARLLVVEDLVCEPNQPCAAKQRDINMLVRTGGRNRTEAEYRSVLARAGLRVTRLLPTSSTLNVIEVVPI